MPAQAEIHVTVFQMGMAWMPAAHRGHEAKAARDERAVGSGRPPASIRRVMAHTMRRVAHRAKGLCLIGATCLLHASPIVATGLADSSDFATVVDHAMQGTVGILAPATSSSESSGGFSVRGSGLYLGDGYVLTARHATIRHEGRRGGHTGDPPQITIIARTLDEASAALIGVNHFLDLALYRIPHDVIPRGLSARRFAETEALPGERVFTVGYPLGWGPAVSYGSIGNPNTFLKTVESRLVQVDLSACSGNSGGGLFNARGDIVGIVHAIIQTDTHTTRGEHRCSRFAFAVPGPFAHTIVTALKRGAPFHFSTLGLRLATVKIDSHWRVAVAHATGPAQRAGMHTGDVLLSIDERRVDSASQLKNYVIEQTRPFQPVTMRILRGTQEHVIRVIPGQARDSVAHAPERGTGTSRQRER